MTNIRTTEGREKLRATPPYELNDGEDYAALLRALDGLDIAQEMVDNLKMTGHEGNTINCLRCRFVAEWDKWKA